MWHELWERLKLSQGLWQSSLLQAYPQSFATFDKTWLDELARLDEKALFQFDETGTLAGLQELRDLLAPLQQILQTIPQHNHDWQICAKEAQGISEKKLHEMASILSLTQTSQKAHSLPWIDWAGGMGHLASRLQHHFPCQVYSCDRDPKLQAQGKDRYADKVQFITTDLLQKEQWAPQLQTILQSPHASIALHACGPLSLCQLQTAQDYSCQWLLNLGCCYHFLQPEQTMLSKAAQQYQFQLSCSALDLAARTRKKKHFEHFLLKKRVNAFRWAVHFFLNDELGKSGFQVIGRAPDRLYRGKFADYAAFAGHKLQLSADTIKSMTQYFHGPVLQKRLEEVFFIHLIRWQFARPLELSIVADRAQLLSEQGFDSQILEIFDARLSPRNLAILAKRL